MLSYSWFTTSILHHFNVKSWPLQYKVGLNKKCLLSVPPLLLGFHYVFSGLPLQHGSWLNISGVWEGTALSHAQGVEEQHIVTHGTYPSNMHLRVPFQSLLNGLRTIHMMHNSWPSQQVQLCTKISGCLMWATTFTAQNLTLNPSCHLWSGFLVSFVKIYFLYDLIKGISCEFDLSFFLFPSTYC